MKNIVCTTFLAACFIAVFSMQGRTQTRPATPLQLLKDISSNRTDMKPVTLPSPHPMKTAEIEPGHELGNVTGTNIDMKVYDHAIAGAIHGAVAWGFFDESAGVAGLSMRKYGQTIKAEFKKQEDGSFGGVIESGEGQSARTTSVNFAGINTSAQTFKLRINEEEITITITAEGFSGGHFINPTYSTVIGGETVTYRFDVECCYGYSINMAMMILGAYAH